MEDKVTQLEIEHTEMKTNMARMVEKEKLAVLVGAYSEGMLEALEEGSRSRIQSLAALQSTLIYPEFAHHVSMLSTQADVIHQKEVELGEKAREVSEAKTECDAKDVALAGKQGEVNALQRSVAGLREDTVKMEQLVVETQLSMKESVAALEKMQYKAKAVAASRSLNLSLIHI
eukprot:TRINITY_DN55410_c0_g1_i1.p1 TRINITY_DN55410_c0_g1~~TRINITY_DN55410_c0_g1_i1.p1  ORF type:complete len:174 (+),score=43.22 TRINITY_DN55410_c0_g1_i1:380-901(+)